jgi:hypothetical protein
VTAQPPPPPPGPPPGPLPPSPAPKARPSAWWFVVGVVLLLLAALVLVVALVWGFRSLLVTDATVPVDGEPHAVGVDTDRDRMLYVDTGAEEPVCTVRDTATGEDLPTARPGGDFTRGTGGTEWRGRWTVDPGSGELEVTCTGAAGTEVQVGPAPSIGGFVVAVLVAVLVPLLLGGAGFVVLLVTGVLWATRPPRRRT